MKVVISLNTSWNIYNFRSGIVKQLLQYGHEVHTIAPLDDSSGKLVKMNCIHHDIQLENSGMNLLNDYKYYSQLTKILSKIKPDVVLSYTIKPNIYGAMACHKLGIPVINNVSGLGTAFLWGKALKNLIQGLYRYAFRNSDHIFFQNAEDQRLFLKEVKVQKERTSILPGSGVNTSFFAPGRQSGDNEKFTFLMISRLLIDKGVEEYCNAAAMLKEKGHEVVFQILGKAEDTHKRGFSSEKIRDLSRRGIIEYLGTTADVRPFIKNADCIVLPSYREGTSKTLLEAASMGKPMIATDVPGCNNVVEDGKNGFLCRVRDSESLADNCKKMLYLDGDTLSRFSESSRSKALADFDEEIVIHRYFEKIEAITSLKVKKSQPKEEVLI